MRLDGVRRRWIEGTEMIDARDLIRHYLATLAYRFQAVVHGAPACFPATEIGYGVRTPIEIVRHMTHVLTYARSAFSDVYPVRPEYPSTLTTNDLAVCLPNIRQRWQRTT